MDASDAVAVSPADTIAGSSDAVAVSPGDTISGSSDAVTVSPVEVVSIPNYSILRRDADERGPAGIAVYVHNSIQDFTHRRYDLESTYVENI